MGWVIRDPVAADAVAIGPMHLRAWHQTYPNVELGIHREWIDENIGHVDSVEGARFRSAVLADARSMPDKVLYRVVESEGAVAGFLHAAVDTVETVAIVDTDDTVSLEALYLLNSIKGSGAADELMDELLSWAGGRPMQLRVATYNHRAIRFYQHYRFRSTDEHEIFKNRIPMQTMRRPRQLARASI